MSENNCMGNENYVLIVDSREHITDRLKERIAGTGYLHCQRRKLSVGDYMLVVHDDNRAMGVTIPVSIERKQTLDELCKSLGCERKRFMAEMERGRNENIRMYLLIEDASWEDIYGGRYRSKMTVNSLVGSLRMLERKYAVTIVFCRREDCGRTIREIFDQEVTRFFGICY